MMQEENFRSHAWHSVSGNCRKGSSVFAETPSSLLDRGRRDSQSDILFDLRGRRLTENRSLANFPAVALMQGVKEV